MAISPPTSRYFLKTNSSQYSWYQRFSGTTASGVGSLYPKITCFDIAMKNRDESAGTVDIYWEFGNDGASNTQFWNRLWRCGYSIVGLDGTVYAQMTTVSGNQGINIMDIDYTSLSRTDSDGNKSYSIIRCGTFTLPCNADGSFSFKIYGICAFDADNASHTSTLSETIVTLPEEYDTPRIYVFNGTTWKAGTPYVFNGTAWKAGTAKVYNGTAWKP